MLGIGILATPTSFQLIGIIGGALGMLIIGSMNVYTMKLQIAAKEAVKHEHHIISYSDLGKAVLGPRGKSFIDILVVFN